MGMRCTMSSRQKLLAYICISMAILLVFCSTSADGLTKEEVSFCIPENSILAEMANCDCFRGGRGGQIGRSCGYSNDLVDLVCTGVSILDLPVDEIYDHITCL